MIRITRTSAEELEQVAQESGLSRLIDDLPQEASPVPEHLSGGPFLDEPSMYAGGPLPDENNLAPSDMVIDDAASEIMRRRGFGYTTDPNDGGQDLFDLSAEAREDARVAITTFLTTPDGRRLVPSHPMPSLAREASLSLRSVQAQTKLSECLAALRDIAEMIAQCPDAPRGADSLPGAILHRIAQLAPEQIMPSQSAGDGTAEGGK
jgi:hypothetical protein